MNISRLSMIGVIRAFHSYCLSRGTDQINHTNADGYASWNACAVGEFTKSIGTPLTPEQVYHNHIEPALQHYQSDVNLFDRIYMRLGHVRTAKLHYPTYDKLAADLGSLIK